MPRKPPPRLRLPIIPGAPWLLDLFCGAGGTGYGFYLAGFNVIGVDIAPQPAYPFTFVQADALKVLRGQIAGRGIDSFAAIHASPPCQHYSDTQRIRSNDHPDLIGPTRDLIAPLGKPYTIENVMGARDELIDPVMLCGAMFPELRVYRHRLFESNIRLSVPQHPQHTHKQTKMGRAPKADEFIHVVGNFSGVAYARKAMGISWMPRDDLREAIPPAYTEYLGKQLIQEVQYRVRHASHASRNRSVRRPSQHTPQAACA